MSTSVVAVLDIGKTNKKVSLYDRSFAVLREERTTVEAKEWNGIEVEDTERVLTWFRETLKAFSGEFKIRAIAITTHGATFVLLDEEGKLALPVISYTAERGAEVQQEFYDEFGSVEELHRSTGSADIGFANMAKVLYFVKTRLPEAWKKCRSALFYGPYFSYELTGVHGLEPTFPGNHSYFWDYERDGWSDVAHKLGADKLFGNKVSRPWDNLGTVKPELAEECGLPMDCKVALGIHDSNANYLPYIALGYDDFLLNSTGTWAVMMRTSDSRQLSDEEIAAKVFFNQDALGRPVRTSLITSGMDYDAFRALTAEKDEGDVEALQAVIAERSLFVVPGVLENGTAFPGQAPRVVQGETVQPLSDLQEAGGTPFTGLGQQYYAALNLGLAIATAKMLETCGIGEGTTVFIEGGFSKNASYCSLLATLCPKQQFALTSMTEGTSFGAALTGWMLADSKSLEEIGQEFTIETREVPQRNFGSVEEYRNAFLKLVGDA